MLKVNKSLRESLNITEYINLQEEPVDLNDYYIYIAKLIRELESKIEQEGKVWF